VRSLGAVVPVELDVAAGPGAGFEAVEAVVVPESVVVVPLCAQPVAIHAPRAAAAASAPIFARSLFMIPP
jgi:hypothetical protein